MGSMGVGKDNHLGITIEGCSPCRLGGDWSFQFNLVNNKSEVLGCMDDLFIWAVTTPDSEDLPKIDVLVEEDRLPQGEWEVWLSNPFFETLEGVFLSNFIMWLNLVCLLGKL